MESLNQVLEEWVLGISVLALTSVLATTSRAALKRLHKDRGWRVLREVAPSLSNLLYVVGLRLFIELAPLHGNAASWLDGMIYVFSVVIYFDIFQRAALLGIEWGAFRTQSSEILHRGFIPLLRNV